MKTGGSGKTLQASLMRDLARYIEAHCDEPVTLARLAQQAQLSHAHLQRRFKEAIGVSPKEYREACRLRKFRRGLRDLASVSDAIYEAGFSSPSRIYERSDKKLGMTPGQYRGGGRDLDISHASADTPLGKILLAATDRGICFLHFSDSRAASLAALEREFPNATIRPMPGTHRNEFERWVVSLSAYLRGETAALDLPLDIRGTAFQTKVWTFLQTIPRGATASYAEVAGAIGNPGASRAVASACARNNVAIAIPCHRVIRGSGELAGYRWGVERKRALLDLEEREPPSSVSGAGQRL